MDTQVYEGVKAGYEIERRWKLNRELKMHDELKKYIRHSCITEVILIQLPNDITIRYRFNRDQYYAVFTIKKGKGLVRREYNKVIEVSDYFIVRNSFNLPYVEYVTGKITFDGFDYDFKLNNGVFIVEREFAIESDAINFIPSKVIQDQFTEITEDDSYSLATFLGLNK